MGKKTAIPREETPLRGDWAEAKIVFFHRAAQRRHWEGVVISAPIKKPACDEAQENVFLMLALCFSYSSLGNIYIFNIEIIFIRRKKYFTSLNMPGQHF